MATKKKRSDTNPSFQKTSGATSQEGHWIVVWDEEIQAQGSAKDALAVLLKHVPRLVVLSMLGK